MIVRAVALLTATALTHAALAAPVADPAPRGLPRRHVPIAAVASNGTRALAAWIDDRSAEATIRATRINEATALDARGIILRSSEKTYGILTTVWNGSEFVVFAPGNDEIVISRVAEDGRVLDAARTISEPAVFITDSAVWNGARYMLLARERDPANNQHILVKLLVLDASFEVERQFVLNPSLAESVGGCRIATDGSNFAVVWERLDANGSTMFVDRYDRDGAPLPRQEVPAGERSPNAPLAVKYPSIAWNGSSFTIVWTNGGVFGASMSPAGAIGEPFRISTANGTFASIGWNGTEHLVTWTVTAGGPVFRLEGALMTPTGGVIATRLIGTTSAGQAQASITSSGRNFALVWFTSIFTIDGTQRPLSSDFAPQSSPKIAGDASGLFAVWSEAGVVYGSRLAPDGTPLDGSGIALGVLPETDVVATSLSVVANGDRYLVAWSSSRGLSCARVSRDGVVLDPGGVTILPDVSAVTATLATDGNDFLLATTDLVDVIFVRIPATGMIRPKLIAIAPTKAKFPQFPIALVWNGESYSLLWAEVTSSHCGFSGCMTVAQRKMTTLSSEDKLATNDVTLEGEVVGLQRSGSRLLYVFRDAGFFYTQRLTIDGTPITPKFRAGDTTATTPAILTETPTGYAIVHPSPRAPNQLAIVHLNALGRWTTTQLAAVPPNFMLSDAASTDSRIAIAYTTTVDLGEELRRAFTTLIRSNQGATRQRIAHH